MSRIDLTFGMLDMLAGDLVDDSDDSGTLAGELLVEADCLSSKP